MSEEPVTDDQSHYEVSLTAGQAFLAFVLLLLSLAASFAFGLMIGRSHEADQLLAQNSPAIVDDANPAPAKKPQERIVELSTPEDTFTDAEPAAAEPVQPARTAVAKPQPAVSIKEEAPAAPAPAPAAKPVPAGAAVPYYAQLLSTTDQKKAEAFAAKLIDGGFQAAYVDRIGNEKGTLYRVRVNFPNEQAARAAEARLRTFTRDVWITRQ